MLTFHIFKMVPVLRYCVVISWEGMNSFIIPLTVVLTQLTPIMTRIGKLWPAGQIRSTTSFCTASELRMVFPFWNGWKKIKRIVCEMLNYGKFKFHCQSIKFYWDIVTLICVRIVYGCFGAVSAELSSCNKDLKYLLFGLLQKKSLLTSDFWQSQKNGFQFNFL